MSEIRIPAAALEAGARALARYNCEQWDNDPDRWRAYFTDEARAAFLAILEAWPGMVHYRGGWEPVTHNNRKPHFILPLTPQETHND